MKNNNGQLARIIFGFMPWLMAMFALLLICLFLWTISTVVFFFGHLFDAFAAPFSALDDVKKSMAQPLKESWQAYWSNFKC